MSSTAFCAVGAVVAVLGASDAAAVCAPPAGPGTPVPGTVVTCSGFTSNQNAPNGYGFLLSGVTVNVEPGATVSGSSHGLSFLSSSNTVNNRGTISGVTGSAILGSTNGNLSNHGFINGFSAGIEFLGANNVVTNTGTILGTGFAVVLGTNAVFTNSGTVRGGAAMATDSGAIITNLATIAGTTSAIQTNNNSTIINFGEISANSFGISAGSNVTITNHGSITASSAVTTATNAVLNNFGVISGGVLLGGFLTGNTTINNFGTISGSIFATPDAIITNRGTIAPGASGGGILVTARASITNFGTISGPGGGTAITFTGGLGRLTLAPGSTIVGNVIAGPTDTLRLGGSGVDVFDLGNIGATRQYRGFGSFQKVEDSTWTLIGAGTQNWTVGGGTLIVDGSLSGSISVNPGATLGGNGTIGSVTLDRATLSPGSSVGTLTINGNLTFVGPGNYVVEVLGATADRTNVTGSATLSGTMTVVPTGGIYTVGKPYMLLNAAGGLAGTFTSVIGSFGPALRPRIVYDPSNVFLILDATMLAPLLPSSASLNQRAVTAAIDAGFVASNQPLAFSPLFNATVDLPAAAAQLSGELATGAPTASFKVMDQFLGLMLDPFLETRLGDGTTTGRALGFAPQSEVQAAMPEALMAYGPMVTKAPPASLIDRRWTVWGAAYGAQGRFEGDALIGSHKLDARNGGFAGGIDYRVSRDSVLGVAVTGAATNWTLDALAGSGRGETVQVGAYASTRFDNAYLSAAFAYGRHDIATDRTVALPGVFDRLSAGFAADSYGGRIEAGYRFALDHGFGVTPYGAFQALSLHTPAYAERDLTGLAGFALTYAGKTTTDLRSELGARLDSRMALDNGALLILRGRAAWAHGFNTDRSLAAVFQTLPVAGFTVIGASAAENAALISAGAELRLRNGVSLSGKFDGEFSGRTTVYAGTGTLRVSW